MSKTRRARSPVSMRLTPDNPTNRARAPRTEHQQLRSAKRANRIRRWLNRCQSCFQRRLLLRAEQMHESKDRPHGRGDPENPTARHKIRRHGHRPGNRREEQQNRYSYPLKPAPRFRVHVRIASAHRTHPAFPKSARQNRNPKNMPHVKRPHLHCTPRFSTRQAVIVSKRHALRLPMINAINDDRHSPPFLSPRVSKILHPAPHPR